MSRHFSLRSGAKVVGVMTLLVLTLTLFSTVSVIKTALNTKKTCSDEATLASRSRGNKGKVVVAIGDGWMLTGSAEQAASNTSEGVGKAEEIAGKTTDKRNGLQPEAAEQEAGAVSTAGSTSPGSDLLSFTTDAQYLSEMAAARREAAMFRLVVPSWPAPSAAVSGVHRDSADRTEVTSCQDLGVLIMLLGVQLLHVILTSLMLYGVYSSSPLIVAAWLLATALSLTVATAGAALVALGELPLVVSEPNSSTHPVGDFLLCTALWFGWGVVLMFYKQLTAKAPSPEV